MIKMKGLNEKSKIYILTPAYIKTGGTELLHQLFYKLTQLEKDVYIVYLNKKLNDTSYIPEEFKIYNPIECEFDNIEYNENNLLIIPEIYISKLKELDSKNIKKAVWWLSVDNATKFFGTYGVYFYMKKKGFLRTINAARKHKFIINTHLIKKIDYHFCQSYYAIEFLRKQKIIKNVFYLSDYINKTYFEKDFNKSNKENIVLYNPKKGFNYTKKLIEKSKFNWIPLENMTTTEVRDILLKSKVYIDFGNHPGKDRFPREAAISGCCIITGKRGAANFQKDVPIDDEFKFVDKNNNINNIINKIQSCLNNYSIEIEKFEKYRAFIREEENNFEKDVKRIFDGGIK